MKRLDEYDVAFITILSALLIVIMYGLLRIAQP